MSKYTLIFTMLYAKKREGLMKNATSIILWGLFLFCGTNVLFAGDRQVAKMMSLAEFKEWVKPFLKTFRKCNGLPSNKLPNITVQSCKHYALHRQNSEQEMNAYDGPLRECVKKLKMLARYFAAQRAVDSDADLNVEAVDEIIKLYCTFSNNTVNIYPYMVVIAMEGFCQVLASNHNEAYLKQRACRRRAGQRK